MIVVSDASPLIGLAAIGRLDLLQQLYHQVLVPNAVFDEVQGGSPGRPGAREVAALDWIESRPVRDTDLVRALSWELDPGEAEAIALAREVGADFLLVDERRARRAAQRLGIPVLGVLGVLVLAKARGLVPALRPILDELLAGAGFYISQALREEVLHAVGEPDTVR